MNGACFKARLAGDEKIEVGSTKLNHLGEDAPILQLSIEGYLSLVDRLSGASSGDHAEFELTNKPTGDVDIRSTMTGVQLRFDSDEVGALVRATRGGDLLPLGET